MSRKSADVGEITERLRIAAGGVGGWSQLADRTGIPIRTLNDYAAGKKIPVDRLVAIADATGMSIAWLAAGRGPARLSGAGLGEQSQSFDQGAITTEWDLESHGFAMIPRYDVSASAGPGLFSGEEHVVDHMAFRLDWVRRAVGVDPSNLCLISAIGDSMEPTIRSGDLLLIDRSIDRILDDAIYVIVRAEVLVVKRIQRFFGGAITIKSDNPAYVDETLAADELDQLAVAGRVRWIARML